MTDRSLCAACSDSGWITFKRDRGQFKNLPYAAACRCEKGELLANPREPTPGITKPVIVIQVDVDLYHRRLRAAGVEVSGHGHPRPDYTQALHSAA